MASLSAPKTLSQGDARLLVGRLESAGDRLEEKNDPAWIALAQAAATLEAIRLGLLQVETHAHIGSEVLA